MYDKVKEQWRFRQTGIMVAVPKLMGQISVGRTTAFCTWQSRRAMARRMMVSCSIVPKLQL
jgi:hypothetical protein